MADVLANVLDGIYMSHVAMGLRLNPVLLFVSPEFAAICAAPTPVSEHVASALAANTRTPTPVIGYVAVSPAVTNDGPLKTWRPRRLLQ